MEGKRKVIVLDNWLDPTCKEPRTKRGKFAAQFVGLEGGDCDSLSTEFLGWFCFTVQVPAIECIEGVFVCIGTYTDMDIYGYVQVQVHVHSTQWIGTDTRRHYGAYGDFVDEVDGGLELSWF